MSCALFFFPCLQEYADTLHLPFLETSAKCNENKNVDEAFHCLAREILTTVGPSTDSKDRDKIQIRSSSKSTEQTKKQKWC